MKERGWRIERYGTGTTAKLKCGNRF